MDVTFNGKGLWIDSVDGLTSVLDGFFKEPQFELWISAPDGPSLCMLRNGDNAWLMHLSFNGDVGVVSKGDQSEQGSCAYTLSNGQVDEYPLSWCIALEQCCKAFAHFFINNGARYDGLEWQIA